MLGGQVGIDLGGRYVGVSQEFLDGTQVGAAIQHMGGKTVPEGMGANLGI